MFASVFYLDIFCFFFKQKTAYEMRISDWSSDVCSSDLEGGEQHSHDLRRSLVGQKGREKASGGPFAALRHRINSTEAICERRQHLFVEGFLERNDHRRQIGGLHPAPRAKFLMGRADVYIGVVAGEAIEEPALPLPAPAADRKDTRMNCRH